MGLQKREQHMLSVLQSRWVNADVRVWTLAEFLEAPERNLSAVLTKDRAHSSLRHRFTAGLPQIAIAGRVGGFPERVAQQGIAPGARWRDF